MTHAIQNKAMLATLSISQWTARKADKSVSAEVEKAHGAHDAGKYNKLLVDKALLEPISKLTARVREFHYCMTLSWSDSGARILPAKLFMDYTTRLRGYKSEFETLVKNMLQYYPAEVQAARVRLGTMYNPGDYPEAWELGDRFSINVEFTPVPDGSDFRVELGDEAQAELRASVTQAVAERQAGAVKATYGRIRDVVSKIEERLSIPDAIFKDTLVTNAIELCQVLDGLNITDDPTITALCQDMRDHLLMPPSVLRSNGYVREVTAGHAQRILATLPT
jgi:hypothetical protein